MIAAARALLASLLASKKFVALVGGGLSALAVRKLGLEPEVAAKLSEQLVALVAAYLVGQGLADLGKEARKVERAS